MQKYNSYRIMLLKAAYVYQIYIYMHHLIQTAILKQTKAGLLKMYLDKYSVFFTWQTTQLAWNKQHISRPKDAFVSRHFCKLWECLHVWVVNIEYLGFVPYEIARTKW